MLAWLFFSCAARLTYCHSCAAEPRLFSCLHGHDVFTISYYYCIFAIAIDAIAFSPFARLIFRRRISRFDTR